MQQMTLVVRKLITTCVELPVKVVKLWTSAPAAPCCRLLTKFLADFLKIVQLIQKYGLYLD